ncbi:MAG: helix-turn-helix domain-containing protein [Candidatus Binatia bacterium]
MPTKKPTKKTYTITEAAKKLGVKRQAVHEAIKKGLLEAERGEIVQTRVVKVTVSGWKISAKSLDAYRVSDPHQKAGKKTS